MNSVEIKHGTYLGIFLFYFSPRGFI